MAGTTVSIWPSLKGNLGFCGQFIFTSFTRRGAWCSLHGFSVLMDLKPHVWEVAACLLKPAFFIATKILHLELELAWTNLRGYLLHTAFVFSVGALHYFIFAHPSPYSRTS